MAAIVLVAVRGLIDLAALRHLWRVSRFEFSISMVALVGVLLLGILKGVLVAVVVSLLMLITTASRPRVAFLGRIPGTRRYSDLERHSDNEEIPGVLIFRIQSSLLYFNVDHVRTHVWERILACDSLRLVVCDLSNSPQIDVAGAAMLAALHKDLSCAEFSCELSKLTLKHAICFGQKGLKSRLVILDGTCPSNKQSLSSRNRLRPQIKWKNAKSNHKTRQ